VAQAMGVDQSTVVQWTSQVGARCPELPVTNQRLQPNWRGMLGIDGKFIHVAGRWMCCLLAVDIPTVDIVQCEVVPAEDEAGGRRFLTHVHQQMEPRRGIVSDFGKGRVWIKLVAEVFPDVPHQACLVHFDRYVDQTLPKSKRSPQYEANQILRRLIHDLLLATNFNDAEEIFTRLIQGQHYFPHPAQQTVLKSLRKHFDLLTAHFHHPDLETTNNATENVIKQLDRKLFLLSDFASAQAAMNFIKLWVMWYRFKPLASSQYSWSNGLSPLQLAGVETEDMDWLDFALSPNN
jgi:hypothetical protein